MTLTCYFLLPKKLPCLKVDLLVLGGLIPVQVDVLLLESFLVLTAKNLVEWGPNIVAHKPTEKQKNYSSECHKFNLSHHF